MKRTIQDVVDGLIKQIIEYGCKELTIRLYKDVCHSLINHCNINSNDLYSDQIPDEFLNKAEECFKNGNHCYEYHRFVKRVIRLLDTFARTGKPDFSVKGIQKKYVPSLEHQDLINRILNENGLVNDARLDMDRIMRHFFCFLEDISIEVADLNDNTLFRFVQLAANTKQGTMYRVIRAMRLLSEFLKRHQIAELKADFSMIQLKSAPVRMIAPFSHDEINHITGCINIETSLGLRNQAIVLLALITGLRGIDIIRLRRSDID